MKGKTVNPYRLYCRVNPSQIIFSSIPVSAIPAGSRNSQSCKAHFTHVDTLSGFTVFIFILHENIHGTRVHVVTSCYPWKSKRDTGDYLENKAYHTYISFINVSLYLYISVRKNSNYPLLKYRHLWGAFSVTEPQINKIPRYELHVQ